MHGRRYGVYGSSARRITSSVVSHVGAKMFATNIGSRLSSGNAYHRAKRYTRGITPYAKSGIYGRGSRNLKEKKDIMAPTPRNIWPKRKLRTPKSSAKKTKFVVTATSKSVAVRKPYKVAPKKTNYRGVNNGHVSTKQNKPISDSFPQIDYQKAGSVICLESGGTCVDANCAYVGAGTPIAEVFHAFCRTLVCALVKRAGRSIVNWNDKFSLITQQQIDITYVPDFATTQTQLSISIAPSTTYQQVAIDIRVALQAAFSAPNNVHWLNAVLYEFTDALTKPIVTAILPLQQLMMDLEVGVTLNIQNQTPSDTADYATDVVNSNPLKGRVYEVKGNFFEPRNISDKIDPATLQQYEVNWALADYTRGEFRAFPFDKATKKPPVAGYFARIITSQALTLLPGQLHSVKGKRTQTMSWSIGMTKLLTDFYEGVSLDQKNPFLGMSLMVAMEKMMDTRLVAEAPVILGYQSEVWVKCKYHFKKPNVSSVIHQLEENEPL